MWASVWGSVGEWVGGTASAGALLLALFILMREVRLRRQSQADQVACWLEFSDHGAAIAVLRNTAAQPIFLPNVTSIAKAPWTVWWYRKYRPGMHSDKNPECVDLRDYVKWAMKAYGDGMEIESDEKCERLLELRYHFQYYITCIEFKDAFNRKWIRDLSSGKYRGRCYRIRRWTAGHRYDNSALRPPG